MEEAPCDLRSKWEQELAAQRSGEKVTAGRGSSKCQGPEAGKVSVLAEQGDTWRGRRVVNGGATPTSHYFLSAMERSSGSLLPILKLPRLSVATFFFFLCFLIYRLAALALCHGAGAFVVTHRFFSCGVGPPLAAGCGLGCSVAGGVFVPRPGVEPTSPAWQGRCLTTGPPGKAALSL